MGDWFAWMSTGTGWASFMTLALLEIVLGIDNVIFISIAASKLPREQQAFARRVGLAAALILRIILLSMLVWLAGLTKPLFTLVGHPFSARDLILMLGGAYLVYKATLEIGDMVRAKSVEDHAGPKTKSNSLWVVIAQIAVIDVIFAVDSIVTAIGMSNDLPIMISAVVIAILVMMFASEAVSAFIDKYETTKMLALAFLLIVGMVLIADGFGYHIERAYLYAAIAFSVIVEALNILNTRKVELLLLDVTMPEIDGLELCRTIRSIGKFKDVPVIMLTAKDGLIDKVKGQFAGATHYMAKPVDREKLLPILEKYISVKEAAT